MCFPLSMKERLDQKIKDKTKIAESSMQHQSGKIAGNKSDVEKLLKTEIKILSDGGSRGENLQNIYELLLNIKPTSVESERAFSAAGLICTKIRSKLGDSSLDALCFLRSYFLNDELKAERQKKKRQTNKKQN